MLHVQVDAVSSEGKKADTTQEYYPMSNFPPWVEVSPNQLEGLVRCTTLLFPNDCEVSYTRTGGKAHG